MFAYPSPPPTPANDEVGSGSESGSEPPASDGTVAFPERIFFVNEAGYSYCPDRGDPERLPVEPISDSSFWSTLASNGGRVPQVVVTPDYFTVGFTDHDLSVGANVVGVDFKVSDGTDDEPFLVYTGLASEGSERRTAVVGDSVLLAFQFRFEDDGNIPLSAVFTELMTERPEASLIFNFKTPDDQTPRDGVYTAAARRGFTAVEATGAFVVDLQQPGGLIYGCPPLTLRPLD